MSSSNTRSNNAAIQGESNNNQVPLSNNPMSAPSQIVPLPSSSGGTDYGDYYKYQQIQQIHKMQ